MRACSSTLALFVIAASLGQTAGCDAPGYPPFDREALLRETTEMVILPGFADAATRAGALHTAASALCASPSNATLTSTRSAWIEAMRAWHRTSAYQFGPVRDMNLGPEVASWPTDTIAIETNIAATGTIDAHYVDALGSGSKGIYALEYLLFAYPSFAGADDARTLAALGDARRCAYTVALADHVERTTARAGTAWATTGGNFAATFIGAGNGGNATYSSQQAAANALVSQIQAAVDTTKARRVGAPLGRTVATGAVESPYARASVASMEASMDGVHDAWSLAPHGLEAFLRSRNATLADTMLAELASTSAALAALEAPPLATPWESYVAGTDHATGNAAYAQLGMLEATIAGDVAATLGLSVVSIADGD